MKRGQVAVDGKKQHWVGPDEAPEYPHYLTDWAQNVVYVLVANIRVGAKGISEHDCLVEDVWYGRVIEKHETTFVKALWKDENSDVKECDDIAYALDDVVKDGQPIEQVVKGSWLNRAVGQVVHSWNL